MFFFCTFHYFIFVSFWKKTGFFCWCESASFEIRLSLLRHCFMCDEKQCAMFYALRLLLFNIAVYLIEMNFLAFRTSFIFTRFELENCQKNKKPMIFSDRHYMDEKTDTIPCVFQFSTKFVAFYVIFLIHL